MAIRTDEVLEVLEADVDQFDVLIHDKTKPADSTTKTSRIKVSALIGPPTSGMPGGGVFSFNGREGSITPEEGDYSANQVTLGSGTGLSAGNVKDAITELNNEKQDELESGVNIKTVNGQSVVGAGDVAIDIGEITTAANTGSGVECYKTKAGTELKFRTFKTSDFELDGDLIKLSDAFKAIVAGKMATTTFKTINGQSVTGTGDIDTLETADTHLGNSDLTVTADRILNVAAFLLQLISNGGAKIQLGQFISELAQISGAGSSKVSATSTSDGTEKEAAIKTVSAFGNSAVRTVSNATESYVEVEGVDVRMPDIAEVIKTKALYFDPATKKISYGNPGEGGGATLPAPIEFEVGDPGMPADTDTVWQDDLFKTYYFNLFRNGVLNHAVGGVDADKHSVNTVDGEITVTSPFATGEKIKLVFIGVI